MRLSADLPPSGFDGGLRTLSNAANHSVLWMGVAAGMGLAGGRARRAAVRGVLAVAGASALSNAVLKPVFPRRRPPAGTPEFTVRRGLPAPRSSSFPSGHSASAAAFATAVALEYPAAGVALAPLAAAVAYSRVHTGVHWPSDIAVGAGVGAAVALATRRWWAVRDEEPATLGPDRTTQALVEGDGMVVFVNPGPAATTTPSVPRSSRRCPRLGSSSSTVTGTSPPRSTRSSPRAPRRRWGSAEATARW